MNIVYLMFLICLFPLILKGAEINDTTDYFQYHKQVIEAEKLISEEAFKEALNKYEHIFSSYDFIFLRDYQVVTQLALITNDKQKALQYLKKGISAGWELKAIKKNKYLSQLSNEPQWKSLMNNYDKLWEEYAANLNQPLRKQVKEMFAKDQRKALGALFRIGDKAQQKYAQRKFAPHSEIQLSKLFKILETCGYPGEKIIGNSFWMSTILTHHNSISKEYAQKDTLYTFLKPKLYEALKKGQMSPYEYAAIDDWHRQVVSDGAEPGYGFLNPPNQTTLSKTNELRQIIGLSSIELRNKLVDVEQMMGMNFYLPGSPWVQGRIMIKEK